MDFEELKRQVRNEPLKKTLPPNTLRNAGIPATRAERADQANASRDEFEEFLEEGPARGTKEITYGYRPKTAAELKMERMDNLFETKYGQPKVEK